MSKPAWDVDCAAELRSFVVDEHWRDFIHADDLLRAAAEIERLGREVERLTRERDEARGILNQCWDAAGLLGPRMTGQPEQAWETFSDLVPQISDLASKAANRDDAEEECESLRRELTACREERDGWVKAVDRHVSNSVWQPAHPVLGTGWHSWSVKDEYPTREAAEAAYRRATGLEAPDAVTVTDDDGTTD